MPAAPFAAMWSRLRRSPPPEGSPTPSGGPPLDRPRDTALPAPLFDLRRRLVATFDLSELRDLAFESAIEPDSVPGDTRQEYALGLARAAWCRGRLPALLAVAARESPHAAWTLDPATLPAPPAEGCEEDPLPRPSVFGDSRQVATFVLLLLAAAAVVAAGVWWAGRPQPMTADFNIAVAAVDVAALDTDAETIGQMLQQQVVAIVEGQLPDDTTATTAVTGERMPVVGDATAAARLAEQIDAQLVIYGSAEAAGDTIRYTPRFYVLLDTVQADVGEMQGDASLEAPLSFTLPELLEATPPTGRTAAAAGLLTSFVRALVNVAGDNIPAARRHIDTAVAQTERYVATYEPFAGREVVYLFASHIARLQAGAPVSPQDRAALLAVAQTYIDDALTINPNYGRGHIGRANLLYDQGDLYGALQAYATAAALTQQPPDALVGVKADMGSGNVNLAQLIGHPIGEPCVDETRRLADQGLRHYGAVVAAFEAGGDVDPRLREMALAAHYSRAKIHVICGEAEAAAAELRAALALAPAPPLETEIRALLATLDREES